MEDRISFLLLFSNRPSRTCTSARTGITAPYAIAVDGSGNIWVTDPWGTYYSDRLGYVFEIEPYSISPDGTLLNYWGTYGDGNGQFERALGIGVSPLGYVYVADSGYNNRIEQFDTQGNYIRQWGCILSHGSGNNQFFYPYQVAVDTFGNVYVADSGNQRVQKFDADGNFITQIGGGSSGQFLNPQGVAVDSLGEVYVSDCYRHHVQEFVPPVLRIVVHSPVNVLVTDSSGHRVGSDALGAVFNEISGATYTGPGTEPQVITLPGSIGSCAHTVCYGNWLFHNRGYERRLRRNHDRHAYLDGKR